MPDMGGVMHISQMAAEHSLPIQTFKHHDLDL